MIMGAEQPLHIGRRRDSRLRVTVPARLITLTGHHKVALRDISQTGAKLSVPEQVRAGDDGVLEWLDFETFGSIIWTGGGFAGIAFDEELPVGALLTTRQKFDQGAFKTEEDIAREQAAEWCLGFKNLSR